MARIIKDARGLALQKNDAVCWVYSHRQGGSMLTGRVVDLSGRYVKVEIDNSRQVTVDKRGGSLYKLSKGRPVKSDDFK